MCVCVVCLYAYWRVGNNVFLKFNLSVQKSVKEQYDYKNINSGRVIFTPPGGKNSFLLVLKTMMIIILFIIRRRRRKGRHWRYFYEAGHCNHRLSLVDRHTLCWNNIITKKCTTLRINTSFISKSPSTLIFEARPLETWKYSNCKQHHFCERNKDFSKAVKVGTRGARHQPDKCIYLGKEVQHSELISLLLQPHLQHALDSPTTTSRSFLSALRRASSTSSEISECAERLCSAATRPRSEVCSFHV